MDKGFTIIELLVVILLLSIVLTAVVGIFVSVAQHQVRVLEEQEMISQASYVIEYISKALRMAKKDARGICITRGYDYELVIDRSTVANADIKFINGSNDNACQEFFFDGSNLQQSINGGPVQNLMSERFKINKFKFILDGDENVKKAPETGRQPRITFILEIQSKIYGIMQRKTIQTTVSQRDLNVE